jgi:hypothetical protein
MNIEEQYPEIDWNNSSMNEIQRSMIIIDVYGSLKFLDQFCESDKEQLYKFAKIVSNYIKMKNIEFLSDTKKYNM